MSSLFVILTSILLFPALITKLSLENRKRKGFEILEHLWYYATRIKPFAQGQNTMPPERLKLVTSLFQADHFSIEPLVLFALLSFPGATTCGSL